MSGSYTYADSNTPKISVSRVVGILEGKSSLMIFDRSRVSEQKKASKKAAKGGR